MAAMDKLVLAVSAGPRGWIFLDAACWDHKTNDFFGVLVLSQGGRNPTKSMVFVVSFFRESLGILQFGSNHPERPPLGEVVLFFFCFFSRYSFSGGFQGNDKNTISRGPKFLILTYFTVVFTEPETNIERAELACCESSALHMQVLEAPPT